MIEAEISPSGEIMVNKQKCGQMEGFRLAASAENADALKQAMEALRPLLAENHALRAERFAAGPNSDISLSGDGSVRWLGQIIAKLKPSEDILRPQFILLADEELAPEAREKISQRLARFISFYFETALKPLYDLQGAEALFEKPRAVALRLVEHLGIVPRRDIAAQIKELSQEERAALRRFGVRFGVYHIFVPALLKPAPARALTLLWALSHDALAAAGYDDIVACLMAGRTSFAVNEAFNRQFYRLAGYRVLGGQAVRIDILERCADLIRQAVSWAAGASVPRPDGAYDGRRFTVSQAMLSILGTKPEYMEEILRHLGYVAQPVSEAEYQAFLAEQAKKAQSAKPQANLPEAEPVGAWPQREQLNSGESEAKAQNAALAKAETKAAPAASGDKAELAASGDETRPVSSAASSLPAAEPVGPRFAAKETAAPESKIILLWHYQKHQKRNFNKDRRPNRPAAARSGIQANQQEAGAGGGQTDNRRSENRREDSRRQEGRQTDSRRGGRNERTASETQQAQPQAESRPQKQAGAEYRQNGRPARDRRPPRDFDKNHKSAGPRIITSKASKPINIEDSPFAALLALRDKLRK